MSLSGAPLVSVGLPVFNGAAHLGLTIAAILNQSYKNIELIICDNASTDDTVDIAQKYALKDNRIRLIKNETNIGIFNNFSKVLREASGEYFMWAAFDDLHSLDFIEECVSNLHANPRAVLCQTRVAVCLENTDNVIFYANLNSFVHKQTVTERYKETLFNFPAVAIYGVYRAKIAKDLNGFRNIPGGDLLWIQELSLYGEFIQSDKILFHYIARAKWNTFESDVRNLGSQPFYLRNPIFRAAAMLVDRIRSIQGIESNQAPKARLMMNAILFSFKMLTIRAYLKVAIHVGSRKLIVANANRLYWKFLHNPNTQIVDKRLFQERVINPTVGIN